MITNASSTQKPLPELLDEIEADFQGSVTCIGFCPDCARNRMGVALVKALRRATEVIRIMGDNEEVMVRSDISPGIELREITAILNQDEKRGKDLGKRGAAI